MKTQTTKLLTLKQLKSRQKIRDKHFNEEIAELKKRMLSGELLINEFCKLMDKYASGQ